MNDQRRLLIALGSAVALAGGSLGVWALWPSSTLVAVDEEMLDDLEHAPLLAKGDRQPPARPVSVVRLPGPVASDVQPENLPRRAGLSYYRPPEAPPVPGQRLAAYVDPTRTLGDPTDPFRSVDRGSAPEAAPEPEEKPEAPAAGQMPKGWRPGLTVMPDLPLPARKPKPPRATEVAAAPTGPLALAPLPGARPAPGAAPGQIAPAGGFRLASGPNPGQTAPAPAAPATTRPPSGTGAELVPGRAGETDPPGLEARPKVQLAALTPTAPVDQSRPNVILRTPFGTPFVLQTDSVDMSCAPPRLVTLLREFEKKYGKKVVVTSGYRTRGRNGSLHMRCMAADIIVPGVGAAELARFARSVPGMGGVGRYCHDQMIHVDIGTPREWKYGCGSYFVARDGSKGEWGRVPSEARSD